MNRASMRIPFFALLIWQAGLAAPALAQEALPAGAESIPRTSSAEAMQRPVSLEEGAGKLHQKVSTDSAEAQAYYDQGVAYLHSYVWVEAARSFHEALRRHPELAMAHLGLAKAYTGATAYGDAFHHLKQAATLAADGKTSKIEAKWIALGRQQMEAIFASDSERGRLHAEYKESIEDLIAMDTDDAHAWVLRGNAEESSPAGRGQGGRVGSIAYYEAALKRDPSHWGADHYLVHTYEGLGLYEMAAEHGKKYAEAVSGVPHAQHMYAHVLPRLGRWQLALAQLGKADRLQRNYFESGVAPVEEWHHGHNIHLMGTVQLRLGNEKEAGRLLREAFYLEVRSLRDGRFTQPWLDYLLLRGRFEEALAAAKEAEQRPLALARLIGAVRASEALLNLKRFGEARQARERAKVALEQFRKDTDNAIYGRLAARYEQRLLKTLDAQTALFGDNPESGEEHLRDLADGYAEATGFDGWVTGLFHLEQLAGFAQRAGRTELAEELRGRMQQIDPEYKSSLAAAAM